MNFGRYWDHLLCKSTIDKNRRCNDTMVKCMLLCTRLTEFNINLKWKRNMNDVHRKFGWNPLPIAEWYLLPKKIREMRESEKFKIQCTNCSVERMMISVVFVEWPKLHTNTYIILCTHTTHAMYSIRFVFFTIVCDCVCGECGIEATSNNLELDNLKRSAAGIINRDSCQPGLRKCTPHTHIYIVDIAYVWSTHSRWTRALSYK